MHWLKRESIGNVRGGKYQQRGAGFVVLCRDCNSKLGRWYVREYAAWARRGAHLIRSMPSSAEADANPAGAAAEVVFQNVRPLLFLKQVAAMLLAVNRAEVGDQMAELRAFVLDRHAQHLPERYAFYLAMYRGPSARYCGLSGTLHIITREQHFLSEVAYPPFACCLSVDEQTPLLEYGNMSHFKNYDSNAVADAELQLIVGFGHTPYPADYRSMAAIERDRESEQT
jgi:hypothetical protein